jgi:DNA-directed RNA polymerase subunit M/transcription elongation factor TFIIS
MALKFKCPNCGGLIVSKFLKVGEEIKCKKCEYITPIPKSAIGKSESSMKIKNDKGVSTTKNTGLSMDIEKMFGKPLLKVDGGVMEELYLYKKKIIIVPRESLLGKVQGGMHEIIYLKHIKDIEFKNGGSLANGYIQFRTSSSANYKTGGILPGAETANDQNTIHFRKNVNKEMFKVLTMVDKYIEQKD